MWCTLVVNGAVGAANTQNPLLIFIKNQANPTFTFAEINHLFKRAKFGITRGIGPLRTFGTVWVKVGRATETTRGDHRECCQNSRGEARAQHGSLSALSLQGCKGTIAVSPPPERFYQPRLSSIRLTGRT